MKRSRTDAENTKPEAVRRKRSCKAWAGVALLCGAFAFACVFASPEAAAEMSRGELASDAWSCFNDGKSVDNTLAELGFVKGQPYPMAEELGVPDKADSAFSTADGQLECFLFSCDAEEAKEGLKGSLEDKGWVRSPADEDGSQTATFLKEEGECRWLMAAITENADGASAVLRIQRV